MKNGFVYSIYKVRKPKMTKLGQGVEVRALYPIQQNYISWKDTYNIVSPIFQIPFYLIFRGKWEGAEPKPLNPPPQSYALFLYSTRNIIIWTKGHVSALRESYILVCVVMQEKIK